MSRRAILIRTVVVGVWAAFFTWLIVTNEVARYLGPRTYWVAWFGMIVLWLVALLGVRSFLRVQRSTEPDYERAVWAPTVMLVPLLVVALVPDPSLGSLAASRKLGGGFSTSALAAPVPDEDGEINFVDVAYASSNRDYAESLGVTEGMEVELLGFVSKSELDDGTGFRLTRFSIYCCAADVVPYSVDVHTAEPVAYEKDQWLRVDGRIVVADGSYEVEAVSIDEVDEPSDPYI